MPVCKNCGHSDPHETECDLTNKGFGWTECLGDGQPVCGICGCHKFEPEVKKAKSKRGAIPASAVLEKKLEDVHEVRYQADEPGVSQSH